LDRRRDAVSISIQGAAGQGAKQFPPAIGERFQEEDRETCEASGSEGKIRLTTEAVHQAQVAVPFLKFGRDKRGYETTALVHAVRRQGRSRHNVLYWFRTPPGVKVGRPALDEAAIRWIEDQNPDIEFDWPKILEAKPPVSPPSEERTRQSRRERPGRQASRRPPVGSRPGREPAPEAVAEEAAAESPGPDEVAEDQLPSDDDVVEAVQQITHPEAEEAMEAPAMPIEHAAAPEDLTRLRARFAELLARIAERGGTPERVEELRRQAEALNPDAWVTEEETQKGLAEFGPRLREIRLALGLRSRRRRRGGRRRRSGPETGPEPSDGGGEAA
jgi:hypothetical protein